MKISMTLPQNIKKARGSIPPFEPKFANHSKGNFYISKELIRRMINESLEEFNTNNIVNDEKLAFGHYKESVAMQINDGQINPFETDQGSVIIINIDLHFKTDDDDEKSNDDTNNNTMYLIAMENDQEFRDRVRWRIADFMSAQQIKSKYKLKEYKLPQSSRSMPWYQKGIKTAPICFNDTQIHNIIKNMRFKSLPSKTSKRRQTGNDKINNNKKSRISEHDLKYYVEQSLKYDNNSPIHPVVVIKGKHQWIEWKRYIEIYDDNGDKQSVGISMRYYELNKQWRIECMDYDAGRIYYQHRLVSLSKDDPFNYSYNQLSKYVTTTLEIYNSNRRNSPNCHSKAHHHGTMTGSANIIGSVRNNQSTKPQINSRLRARPNILSAVQPNRSVVNVNMDLNAIRAFIEQCIDDIRNLPVPRGFILVNNSISSQQLNLQLVPKSWN